MTETFPNTSNHNKCKWATVNSSKDCDSDIGF